MLLDGVLNPRESGIFIAQNSQDIQIDELAIKNVALMIHDAVKSGEISDSDFEAYDMHTKAGDQQAVEWIFFVDLINFSFWMDDGSCFAVSYTAKNGVTSQYSGYFAACACVNRALDKGIQLTDASYMANMQEEELAKIFQSDSGQTIPLIKERCSAIREAGKILCEKFNRSFYNCVLQCDQSAQSLLKLIVENFESFRDFAIFKNKKVSLLKRAQILVSDIHGCLRSKANPVGDFSDIGSLTMFADYRVPQALAFLGVLKYSEKLLNILRSNPFLKNGSEVEVMIRGNSIYACDKIAEEVERLRLDHSTKSKQNGSKMELRQLYPVDIDMYLWLYRRKHADQVEAKVPFHKTRCIYY